MRPACAAAVGVSRLQATGHEGWLLAGRKAGTHITAERLRDRLKPYGITSRAGRQVALLALAARLPAPILAERIGIHQARAAQWVRAAGATYADYVGASHSPLTEAGGEFVQTSNRGGRHPSRSCFTRAQQASPARAYAYR